MNAEFTVKSLLFSLLVKVNRESQWDLFHDTRNVCYNQLRDKREPPWAGTTKTFLLQFFFNG